MIGKILQQRYQIISLLGKGGQGYTYLALDTQHPNNRQCVVKQFKPYSSNPRFLETAKRLFQNEAKILANLENHPQIPQLYAYFEQEQEFYLVQEYIAGKDLTKEIIVGQKLDESYAIELLQSLLPVLEFIHQKGVIHRDIKPPNIMRRDSDRQLILIDFGAVKQFQTELTRMMNVSIDIGSLGYAPSEQLRGRPKPNSDLYALGMMCIQALTGVHPRHLEEDETEELKWQHLTSISPGLTAILEKMSRHSGKERYKTATEVLIELNRLNIERKDHKTNIKAIVDHEPVKRQDPTTIVNPQPEKPKEQQTNHSPQKLADTELLPSSQPSKLSKPSKPFTLTPPANSPPINQVVATPDRINQHRDRPVSRSRRKSRQSWQIFSILGGTILAVVLSIIATQSIFKQSPSKETTSEKTVSTKSEKTPSTTEEKTNKTNTNQETTPTPGSNPKTTPEQNNPIRPPEPTPKIEDVATKQAQDYLAKAKQLAGEGNYQEAINQGLNVPVQVSEVYQEAQTEIESWSEKLIEQAKQKYEQEGKYDEAVTMLQIIPETIPVVSTAQQLVDGWRSEWIENQSIMQRTEKAIDEGDLDRAKTILDGLNNTTPYWQSKKAVIEQEIEQKKASLPSKNPSQSSGNNTTNQPQLSGEQKKKPSENAVVPSNPQPASEKKPKTRTTASSGNSDGCLAGYVLRKATQDDRVCVTPETRDRVLFDNSQAASRRNEAAYDPESCIEGYVWRLATPDDRVCVTPETHNLVIDDNNQAASRRVQ